MARPAPTVVPLCVVVWIGLLIGCRSDTCTNQTVAAYPSPGNELTAIVFTRHCLHQGTSTQLSILPAGRILPNRSANVFIVTNQNSAGDTTAASPPVRVEWFGRNRLRVTYDRHARILKQRRSEAAVVIQYALGS
jgi:hypothetical protein